MPEKRNAQFADNYRIAKSQTVYYAAGTYNLIEVPKYSFVHPVWLSVDTAYAGTSVTVTVGWKGNGESAQVAGFMSNNIADPSIVGMKLAQKDSLIASPGKWFNNGSGVITLTVGGIPTAGKCKVFVAYSVIQ
jgi:hypothetical protein